MKEVIISMIINLVLMNRDEFMESKEGRAVNLIRHILNM